MTVGREHPVFVRRSTLADGAELARIAAAAGRVKTPAGVYLIAEIGGRLVAAVSLDRPEPVLHDPAEETADVQDLLRRWGQKLRREARRLEKIAA